MKEALTNFWKSRKLRRNIREFNEFRDSDDFSSVCKAPATAIRFEQEGKTRICCFNVKAVLGYYPKQSIHEMWFGEEAQKLRSKIKQNDFSYGCQLCEQALLNKEYEGTKIRQFDHLEVNPNNYPARLEFTLHNTCNLECIMCKGELSSMIRKYREKLPPMKMAYDDQFFEEIKEFIPHAQQTTFDGGEPFLIPLNYRIWELLAEYPNCNNNITTNGTILNAKVKRVLEAGRFNLCVSIEAIEEELYKSIRVRSKLSDVLSNLEYFIDYCNRKETEISISVCPMQQNWREIPKMIAYCNEKGVKIYLHYVLFPEECAIRNFPESKLKELIQYYEQCDFKEAEMPHELHNKLKFEDFKLRCQGYLN